MNTRLEVGLRLAAGYEHSETKTGCAPNANGRTPGPGLRTCTAYLRPGLGGLPLEPGFGHGLGVISAIAAQVRLECP